MKDCIIIVAVSTNNGIGKNNTIPWHVPEELNNFRMLTSECKAGTHNAIIMGRITWESLPNKPLKNRLNIVISSTMQDSTKGCIVKHKIADALEYAYIDDTIDKIFIMGGSEIYQDMLQNHLHLVNKIYLSVIYDKAYDCDRFIDMQKIYDTFSFDKENIHLTERYMFMIGYKKPNGFSVHDEPVD